MHCAHCLRGEPQKKTIKIEYVDTLFSKVSQISSLTITGGEPSLVPHKIHDIIDRAMWRKVEIESFYIVTNGKRLTTPFFEAVERLYNYCDNEISMVDISKDRYHDKVFHSAKTEAWLDYFENIGILGSKELYTIIGEGRGWGDPPREEDYEFDEYGIIEGSIYLNVKGNIIAGCDWSYETQDFSDEYKICSIKDFSVEKVKEYVERRKKYNATKVYGMV